MFGTAAQSDLRTVGVNVDKLANNQKEITHVVNEIISAIKVTWIDMAKNRETVNRIITSLSYLDVTLGNITQALECEVFQVGQFVQLYSQLNTVILAVRCTFWQTNSYMEHIQLQLNMLSLGHLSQHQLSYQDV